MRAERGLQLGELGLELLEDREVLLALEGVGAGVGGVLVVVGELGAVVVLRRAELDAQPFDQALDPRLLRPCEPFAARRRRSIARPTGYSASGEAQLNTSAASVEQLLEPLEALSAGRRARAGAGRRAGRSGAMRRGLERRAHRVGVELRGVDRRGAGRPARRSSRAPARADARTVVAVAPTASPAPAWARRARRSRRAGTGRRRASACTRNRSVPTVASR